MNESGPAPCQCTSPGGAQTTSPGLSRWRSPPLVSTIPWPLPTISTWPAACECQKVRPPGENMTELMRTSPFPSSSSGSSIARPLNVSASPTRDGVPLRPCSISTGVRPSVARGPGADRGPPDRLATGRGTAPAGVGLSALLADELGHRVALRAVVDAVEDLG